MKFCAKNPGPESTVKASFPAPEKKPMGTSGKVLPVRELNLFSSTQESCIGLDLELEEWVTWPTRARVRMVASRLGVMV